MTKITIGIKIEINIEIEIKIETEIEVATAETGTEDEMDHIETPPAIVTTTPGMEATARGLGHLTITPIIMMDVKDPVTVETAKINEGRRAAKTANRTATDQANLRVQTMKIAIVTLHPANNGQPHAWAHLVVERHW